MKPSEMPRPFAPEHSEIESGPIVPVNCDSCQVRKDQETELSRHRAFVDELKGVMDQWELIGRETFTALLRKHNLESKE